MASGGNKCEIAMVIADLGAGGAQRVLSTLVNHWASLGRRVAVITLAGQKEDFYRLDNSVVRRSLGLTGISAGVISGLFANLKRIRALRCELRKLEPHTVASFILSTNILLLLSSIGLGLRVVISERNDPTLQPAGRIWDFLRRKIYCYANMVTANSNGVLKALARYVPEHKLALVPNPVSDRFFSTDDGCSGRSILAVGRLHRQKAYDVLLKAFAVFSQKHPSWHLEILGDGLLQEELRRQADALGIGSRVIWRGRVEDPLPYYRDAGIFVLPSRYEGMPNVLLEAMACGLPSIVSDASAGPLEYIENGINGIIFPSEDSRALAEALSDLASNEDLCRHFGNESKARVKKRNSIIGVVDKWEQVLGLERRVGH